jgi:hypothetical protein
MCITEVALIVVSGFVFMQEKLTQNQNIVNLLYVKSCNTFYNYASSDNTVLGSKFQILILLQYYLCQNIAKVF